MMIGKRIKELREQHGFTQTVLAKKLGLSRSAVNAWEMGTSVPSVQYLVELARMFHVSSDYLLGIDSAEKMDLSHLSSEEKEILYSLLQYFRKTQNAVLLLQQMGYGTADEDYENPPERVSERGIKEKSVAEAFKKRE